MYLHVGKQGRNIYSNSEMLCNIITETIILCSGQTGRQVRLPTASRYAQGDDHSTILGVINNSS